jgi:hypothetical protein
MAGTGSPAYGILQIIKAVQPSILNGWIGLAGQIADQPDQVFAVLDTTGPVPLDAVGNAIDYPSVQILLRGSKDGYNEAYQQLLVLRDAINRIPSGGEQYPELVSCVQKSMPGSIGRDMTGRPMFSANFQLIVNPANSGYRQIAQPEGG